MHVFAITIWSRVEMVLRRVVGGSVCGTSYRTAVTFGVLIVEMASPRVRQPRMIL